MSEASEAVVGAKEASSQVGCSGENRVAGSTDIPVKEDNRSLMDDVDGAGT